MYPVINYDSINLDLNRFQAIFHTFYVEILPWQTGSKYGDNIAIPLFKFKVVVKLRAM